VGAGTQFQFRIISQTVNRDNGAGPNFDYGAQGDLVFQRKTNNLFSGGVNDITYTEVMRIGGATGNVGIGTASPGYPLDVYQTVNGQTTIRLTNYNTGTAAVGSFAVGTNDSTNRGGLAVFNSTYTASAQYRPSGTYVYCNGSGGLTMHAEGANNLYFATNSLERMRIDSSGDVGIGTTAPIRRLHVNGGEFSFTPSITTAFLNISDSLGNNGGNYSLVVRGLATAGAAEVSLTTFAVRATSSTFSGNLTVPQISTAAVVIGSNTNWAGSSGVLKITGTPGFYAPLGTIFAGTSTENHWEIVNANGMVGAVRTSGSTTTYNSLSDYRTKTNVRPLSNALETISQMKPVKFNFKADLNKDVEGFIAHELHEFAPNAVTGEKDAVFADGSINPQCIDMSFLVPFLVAGMQELSTENTALKDRLDSLESRLAAAGI
jgi:hypothetical protein